MPDPDPAAAPELRNPIGTHVLVGRGLVDGAVAHADEVGCETFQVFVGNPRGWALSPGRPAAPVTPPCTTANWRWAETTRQAAASNTFKGWRARLLASLTSSPTFWEI